MMTIMRWFAVLYPSTLLQSINSAMIVEEFSTEYQAFLRVQELKVQFPGKRAVVRREVETRDQQN